MAYERRRVIGWTKKHTNGIITCCRLYWKMAERNNIIGPSYIVVKVYTHMNITAGLLISILSKSSGRANLLDSHRVYIHES